VHGMTVGCIGGGPGGLLPARLVRLADPATRVTVHERNAPDATFGFGVVFSDRTLTEFAQADPETHRRITGASERWPDMEIRYRGERIRYGGFGFSAIARKTLLQILQEQAREAGVDIVFEEPVGLDELAGADLVVAADGVNSATREALSEHVQPSIEVGAAKYIWFGTTAPFELVTFPLVRNEHGVFAAHAYPYKPGTSTFIVEVDEHTWRRAGMDASTAQCQQPGVGDEFSRRYIERLFAEELKGHELLVNNSKWLNFRELRDQALAPRERRAARRRRAHRALLRRLRHQDGDGGLGRPRPLAFAVRCVRVVRAGAPPGRRAHAAVGPAEPALVGDLLRADAHGAGAVRLPLRHAHHRDRSPRAASP
jgi:2-polyprenyl-6-methoxyphenol hydroxylase-like FAD-dependent oxidoreductase